VATTDACCGDCGCDINGSSGVLDSAVLSPVCQPTPAQESGSAKDIADSTDTADPANTADPTNTADPSNTADPTNTADSTDTADSTHTADSTDTADPTTTAAPTPTPSPGTFYMLKITQTYQVRKAGQNGDIYAFVPHAIGIRCNAVVGLVAGLTFDNGGPTSDSFNAHPYWGKGIGTCGVFTGQFSFSKTSDSQYSWNDNSGNSGTCEVQNSAAAQCDGKTLGGTSASVSAVMLCTGPPHYCQDGGAVDGHAAVV
jgi:hypothetical protein